MKQTLILRSPEIVQRACHMMSESQRSGELHEVTIKPHKRDRSLAQNSLNWVWATTIGNELGEPKEEVHARHKEKYLVPIYERDNEDFAAMIQAVRNVHRQGMKKEALAMKKQIIALTSTSDADVSQMAEFLTCVERGAADLGIVLPRPEDFDFAMVR